MQTFIAGTVHSGDYHSGDYHSRTCLIRGKLQGGVVTLTANEFHDRHLTFKGKLLVRQGADQNTLQLW